jgi:hypothetical protein
VTDLLRSAVRNAAQGLHIEGVDGEATRLMAALDRHLQSFTTERVFDQTELSNALQRGEDMLDAMSGRVRQDE